jgi:hypothetical protein
MADYRDRIVDQNREQHKPKERRGCERREKVVQKDQDKKARTGGQMERYLNK